MSWIYVYLPETGTLSFLLSFIGMALVAKLFVSLAKFIRGGG